MDIGFTNNAFVMAFSAIGTVTIAVFMLLIGAWIKKHVSFCERYCLPTPVIGGVLFALTNLIFHQSGVVTVKLDLTYQNDFQFMFFTIVGFGASFTLLRKGGGKLILYFILTGLLIVVQGVLGVIGADIAGVSRVFGIICGPVPLAGGHGSVAAYAEMLEGMGHQGVMVAGMAAATFGLVVGSLCGGPMGDRLIRKYNLKPMEEDTRTTAANSPSPQSHNAPVTVQSIFCMLALIGFFMTVGSYLGALVGSAFNIGLPGFVGPMFVAFVARNLNEYFHLFKFNQFVLDKMTDISLGIFLAMAMSSLRLWELFNLAGPMMLILSINLIFTLLFTYFIVFRLMGKNFDAAVMCSGLTGHGLGATPNAIANMESITEKHGMSRLAFIIVPIVGGFLQDMFIVPVAVTMINIFG